MISEDRARLSRGHGKLEVMLPSPVGRRQKCGRYQFFLRTFNLPLDVLGISIYFPIFPDRGAGSRWIPRNKTLVSRLDYFILTVPGTGIMIANSKNFRAKSGHTDRTDEKSTTVSRTGVLGHGRNHFDFLDKPFPRGAISNYGRRQLT